MKKRDEHSIKEMDLLIYELCIRQFLGDRGYQSASLLKRDAYFRSYLRKCVAVIKKRIEEIDTTMSHKERLFNEVENLLVALQRKNNEKMIIARLFLLVGKLLGFDFLQGFPLFEISYWQTPAQAILYQSLVKNGDRFELEERKSRNRIKARKEIYIFLKKKGYPDNEIAQIMNTSECQIKKLKRDLQ